jgi:hypothetical protein
MIWTAAVCVLFRLCSISTTEISISFLAARPVTSRGRLSHRDGQLRYSVVLLVAQTVS